MALIEHKSHLATLPEEVVCNVAGRLGSDDLFNLRLTCRALQQHSFHEFANEYFHSKCVHFTSDSLKSMLAITENAHLRPYIHQIWICSKWFTEDIIGDCPCCSWRPSTAKIAEAYRSFALDQAKLKTDRQDRLMLTKIFKNVKQLQLVALTDSPAKLEDNTDYRGLRRFLRTACEGRSGVHPPPIEGYQDWLHHVYETMIRAIVNSGVRVNTLKTAFATADDALTADRCNLLSRQFSCLVPDVTIPSMTALSMQLKSGCLMRCTARLFPNLTDIHLHFHPVANRDSGLAATSIMNALKTEQLKRVWLVGVHGNSSVLLSCFRKLKAVQVLKLEALELETGNEDPSSSELRKDWSAFLRLITGLKDLEHLHLFYPKQQGFNVYLLKNGSIKGTVAILDSMPDHPNQRQDTDMYKKKLTNWLYPRNCGEPLHLQCHHRNRPMTRRGYFVCLSSKEEIKRQMPKFIEQLHVDYDLEDEDDEDEDLFDF